MSDPGLGESKKRTGRRLPVVTAEEVAYRPSHKPVSSVRSLTRPTEVDYREKPSDQEEEEEEVEGVTLGEVGRTEQLEVVPRKG